MYDDDGAGGDVRCIFLYAEDEEMKSRTDKQNTRDDLNVTHFFCVFAAVGVNDIEKKHLKF